MPVSRDDAAIAVWVELEKAGLNGHDKHDLARTTKLTANQVRNGINGINQVLQLTNGHPLVVRRDGNRAIYFLPEVYPEFTPWAINRQRDLLSRAKTQIIRWQAAAKAWPRTTQTRFLLKWLNRVADDIEEMLVEIGPAA